MESKITGEETSLKRIQSVVEDYTAGDFAMKKLKYIKQTEPDYYQYMRDGFSGKDAPDITECEDAAIAQFIREYGDCCHIAAGFIKNGRVFVLDKEEKVVMFLFHADDKYHKLMVHYNPLNVDLIELASTNEQFFKNIETGRYEMSKNEIDLISELQILIKPTTNAK